MRAETAGAVVLFTRRLYPYLSNEVQYKKKEKAPQELPRHRAKDEEKCLGKLVRLGGCLGRGKYKN